MRHLCEHISLTHLTTSTKYTCGLYIGINALPDFWHIIWACGLSTCAAYSRDFTVKWENQSIQDTKLCYHWSPMCDRRKPTNFWSKSRQIFFWGRERTDHLITHFSQLPQQKVTIFILIFWQWQNSTIMPKDTIIAWISWIVFCHLSLELKYESQTATFPQIYTT